MDRSSPISMGLRPTAMILKRSGRSFFEVKWPREGNSLRLAKSPEPPKMMIRQSSWQRPLLLKKLEALLVFSSNVIDMGLSRVGFLQIYKFWSESERSPMPSFAEALETAWNKRSGLRGGTNAFRLLNGAASGTPGLIVDMFGEYLVVYAYEKDMRTPYGDFAARLLEVTGAKGIALKDRGAKGDEGRDTGREMTGSVPEIAEVREGALKFRVHLQHPRNVGLFLDTRLLREVLSRTCRDHDVLNLFSYSCSLGIAAAHANLGLVVNVDLSARYLGWGKENLALNALPGEKTKFVRMDSEKYLDWAAKKAQSYDVVILDPPSFSRSPSGTFSFAQ